MKTLFSDFQEDLQEKLPRRSWIPLYLLYSLKNISTALKFQKLVFLIQVEGKIDEYRFFMHHYGPFSRELEVDVRTLSELNLIRREVKEGKRFPYFKYSITSRGASFVENILLKSLDPSTRKRVTKVIEKHGRKNYFDLLEYVYRKYVIFDRKNFLELFHHLMDDLTSLDFLWRKRYRNDCPASFLILTVIEYSAKVMEKLRKIEDPVCRGVCAASISELAARLIDLTSLCTSEKYPFSFKYLISDVSEYMRFIESYCSRNGILGKILDLDFSEFLDEEELERLEKAFQSTDVIY